MPSVGGAVRAFEFTLGTHAEVLTGQGRCAEARLALAEFFEASRRTGWLRFGQCGSAYVELAFHEQRHSSAATLLGYARAVGWGQTRSADAQSSSLNPKPFSMRRRSTVCLPGARRSTKKRCVR